MKFVFFFVRQALRVEFQNLLESHEQIELEHIVFEAHSVFAEQLSL